MVLALKHVRKTIPNTTSGVLNIPCEETFPTRVNIVDVAIREFKLDQSVQDDTKVQPVDLVQVGARDVHIEGPGEKTVKFTIRCDYKIKKAAPSAATPKYTGEVTALIIADVAPSWQWRDDDDY